MRYGITSKICRRFAADRFDFINHATLQHSSDCEYKVRDSQRGKTGARAFMTNICGRNIRMARYRSEKL
ncbi:hypothetical protein KCP73_18660 [Salmonella enterica subsp. enterica]|nr:hypothetical protein KCP73_18660 [Salmonella enterica subsp. enterica]